MYSITNYEEASDFIDKGIKNILEGLPEPKFTSHDYSMLYTTIYVMCSQKPSHDYSQQLYDKYKEVFQNYITLTVLPSLRGKKDEVLLRELLRRWSNQKTMTKFLSRFFEYLDRYFLQTSRLPSLEETAFESFYYLVYEEMHTQVMQAILAMIDRKQAGEPIDETLINNALAFYSEIGDKTGKTNPKHFVETMINENAAIHTMSKLQIE